MCHLLYCTGPPSIYDLRFPTRSTKNGDESLKRPEREREQGGGEEIGDGLKTREARYQEVRKDVAWNGRGGGKKPTRGEKRVSVCAGEYMVSEV